MGIHEHIVGHVYYHGGHEREHYGCTCATRKAWIVTTLRANYSAFNGYRRTASAYSEVTCGGCGKRWRTKAAYIDTLPRGTNA